MTVRALREASVGDEYLDACRDIARYGCRFDHLRSFRAAGNATSLADGDQISCRELGLGRWEACRGKEHVRIPGAQPVWVVVRP